MSDAKVGQSVQYFNTQGDGPFAATVLGTADSYDPAKAAFDKRIPAGSEVTLEVTTLKGRKYVREYVPRKGTAQHTAAIAWEQAHAPKPAEGEDAPETGARHYTPLA
jgi:hypothetical protein